MLYLDGRGMLRSSEINKIVAEEFDRTKDLAQQSWLVPLGTTLLE